MWFCGGEGVVGVGCGLLFMRGCVIGLGLVVGRDVMVVMEVFNSIG